MGNQQADVITVNERRIAKHFRFLSEVLFNLGTLSFHLCLESSFIDERGQTVGIGLCKKLYTSGAVKFLQFGQHLRGMELQLFHAYTGDGESHFEIFAVGIDHLLQGIQGRHIRTLGNVCDGAFVLIIIIIVVIGTDIEKTVSLQMDYLVYLEI